MADISRVAPRLYVGSAPSPEWRLPAFHVLVLCAAEHQIEMPRFPGKVIRAGIDDQRITEAEKAIAVAAARQVAAALRAGSRVLCTCAQGLNRSALVAALSLQMSTRLPLDGIIARIREKRGFYALSNPYFTRYLSELEHRRQVILGNAATRHLARYRHAA